MKKMYNLEVAQEHIFIVGVGQWGKGVYVGITIEFFSAYSQELVDVFSLSLEQVDLFMSLLEPYPVADFSLHLHIPEDMDLLCQAMRKNSLSVPHFFRELLVKQLWYDGSSESLTLIAENFALICMQIDNTTLENIARDWASEFSYHEPLYQTPAYKALSALRIVAKDAVTHNKSLILHLLGSSMF